VFIIFQSGLSLKGGPTSKVVLYLLGPVCCVLFMKITLVDRLLLHRSPLQQQKCEWLLWRLGGLVSFLGIQMSGSQLISMSWSIQHPEEKRKHENIIQ